MLLARPPQPAQRPSLPLQATVLMVAALQADVSDRDRQMVDLRAAHEADASEVEALQASLLVRETELTSVAADKSTEAAAAAESQRGLSSAQAELAQLRREVEGVRSALASREAELLALTEAHTAAEVELSASRQELAQLRRQAGDLEARVPLLEERAKRGEARAGATEAELQTSRATLTEIQRTAGGRAIELATTLALLDESRHAVVDAEERLAAAMIASEASDRALQDMTNQYVGTRRDLIATSKQMAALAADHSRSIDVLSTTQDDLSAVQVRLGACGAGSVTQPILLTPYTTWRARKRAARDEALQIFAHPKP
jgi:chromosome segregation ATPase